jgi:hypothetical protein
MASPERHRITRWWRDPFWQWIVGSCIALVGVIATLYAAGKPPFASAKQAKAPPSPYSSTPSPTVPTATQGAGGVGGVPFSGYTADWSQGLAGSGWVGTAAWNTVNGMLVNDGSARGDGMSVTAPPHLGSVRDYAVDADIQLVRYSDSYNEHIASFGIIVRAQGTGPPSGYGLGYCSGAPSTTDCDAKQPSGRLGVIWPVRESYPSILASAPFSPDPGTWHRYRVEVRGNGLTLKVDGAEVTSASDNSFLDGGRVGLWSDNVQIAVRSVVITPLEGGGR